MSLLDERDSITEHGLREHAWPMVDLRDWRDCEDEAVWPWLEAWTWLLAGVAAVLGVLVAVAL